MSPSTRNRPDTPPRRIENLESLKRPYVTVSELAAYWGVSAKHLYKQIAAGTLPAIQLGPRLVRVRTSEAIKFEHIAKMTAARSADNELSSASPPRRNRP